MKELAQILADHLNGLKGLDDCAEWLAGIDWDDPCLNDEDKKSLGLFELLIIEVSEGLRDKSELRQEASQFVNINLPGVSAR
ncbi:MAG: hypothetical protein O2909_12830 [Chloroflexi bacterium]|nr:hypothetical protein [Chloroflexota bacterium]